MSQKKAKSAAGSGSLDTSAEASRGRLAATGRNDPCPCDSGKKYKKCHLQVDEAAASPPAAPPDPQEMVANGWRLFEQRRPGAAEKEFRAALALASDLVDARVGIGMARLQAGDNDGARKELGEVLGLSEGLAASLKKEKVKNAFERKEAQSYLRAAHALGCLAYDQAKYDEALTALERVFAIDEGTVGTEARLIAGKTLLKLGRPADAAKVLEGAVESEAGGGRAHAGMALAHFAAGNRAAAEQSLQRALEVNPHVGKALLGRERRRVDNMTQTAPGSREEAVVYAQTYGDVWDADAKKWLEEALAAGKSKAAGAEATPSAAG